MQSVKGKWRKSLSSNQFASQNRAKSTFSSIKPHRTIMHAFSPRTERIDNFTVPRTIAPSTRTSSLALFEAPKGKIDRLTAPAKDVWET